MITAKELERLAESCGRGVTISPDVAEYLEGRANWVWDQADLFTEESANDADQAQAANDTARITQARRPHWTLDSLARALQLAIVEESMPGLIVGAYVRAQRIILVERSLSLAQRAPVVSHECGHATLHAHAPHDEVSYLSMCFLYPSRLLRQLPESRRAVSASWLARAVPYRTPAWAPELRAPMLQRLLDAGRV